jgi:GNAT superfamily N-acetyltransferase
MTEVAWLQTRVLRRQVLGWSGAPVPGDEGVETVHLAVLDAQNTPMAIVSACPHPCPERPGAGATYLWAMAVAVSWRGRGVGSRLVSELARRSVVAGRTVLWADARSGAIGF